MSGHEVQGGEQASIACRLHELEQYCNPDINKELSLEGLRERIAGIPPDAVRDSDFFCLACRNAGVTLEMIKCLLEAFPVAAQSVDGHGCLPLHWACTNKNLDPRIVRLLLDLWPESVNYRSNGGILPLHTLCAYGVDDDTASLAILDLLLKAAPDSVAVVDGNGDLPIHHACQSSRRKSYPLCKRLVDAHPESLKVQSRNGGLPLHYACMNKTVDPRIVQLFLDRWQESVNRQDNNGDLPLHKLCDRSRGDERTASLDVLNLLLAAAPQSVTLAGGIGYLPIHCAILCRQSHLFCKRLIDAYPESLRVRNRDDCLPIHIACYAGRDVDVETVKYMLELYPESVDARDGDDGMGFPINLAAESNGQHKADIIRYLLTKDPDCASKTGRGLAESVQRLPLHSACAGRGACLESSRLLFDAYPEAINIRDGEGKTPFDLVSGVDEVRRFLEEQPPYAQQPEASGSELREFLEAQLIYARLAEDNRAMQTPDENGWLPLHLALRNSASLGAIKLLIAGNPDALQVSNSQSAFPLHIACEFGTAEVVQHLLGLSDNHLHTLDLQGKSTLHYACRGGNTGAVKCLLESGVPSVSEPNSDGKLPIHLLWESGRAYRNSVEYVEANWLLLLAHPETVAS